jgi:hypothetical protein
MSGSIALCAIGGRRLEGSVASYSRGVALL